uniref:Bms1-type G domain-containing protein n=1 Tax=Neobodo designis TaxID=312471 RepID=A0A7S1QYY3_NEODS|mmetsp:Transcript_54849/g.169059  ORF Transcript_54849/g.169059 Transcript_54849/m.169059 type:complete len:789 (+) Transcript_54849:35-2401(+)|eukprot:CAMPEP_0174854206 /NCGR_PEP_ID=MMETSP1114-20130205/30364_1 /TAXON_ID=312471 /ORGANISM="Neobodo designis, Strain CCAP 1951/1" /LENGTH=788 /DNA_ID=CAMNT_0016088887 /DNA_START=35 /DNA_END=2401 /DNA_ORIENTATION=-
MKNKSHKSRHASKGAVARKAASGGRAVNDTSFATRRDALPGKAGNEAGAKAKQQQAALASRKNKMQAALAQKAIGSRSLGGPPRIVTFAPLNESASSHATLRAFCGACGAEAVQTERPVHVVTAKHRFTTVLRPDLDEQRLLDAIKVSDVVVLSLDCSSAVQETIKEINTEPVFEDGASQYSGTTWFADIGLCITDTTRELIRAINSHGCPSVVVALQGLDSYDSDKKRRHTFRIHQRYFDSVMSENTKVLSVDSDVEAESLVRTVANMKLKSLKWREIHPYLLVDERSYDSDSQTLTVSGFLRGVNASASMLFHLTNFETFKASKILAPGDPTGAGDEALGVIDEADEEVQESLVGVQQNETAFDEAADFPTEADVALAEAQKKTVWVPEGVSEYQAAWYDNGDGDNVPVEAVNPPQLQSHHVVDTRSHYSGRSDAALLNAADVLRDETMTDEERAAERARIRDECEDEERHADEVDTPIDIPARQRFAKYRAMKSFSTSAWDPKENLPLEYASIFELSGYAKIRGDAIAEVEQCPAMVGMYISITLEEVPPIVADADLLMCSGQLRHEQKWSVIHCHVQRSAEYDEPIKSKTPMLIHMGFRKFVAEPIYSDAVVGNRSKFARYFLPGERFRIATFYAPIAYHPTPVIMYEAPSRAQVQERAPLRLTVFGSVLPPNPNFLVLKRVVLTGRIATIYKKVLIVKFMFFNEDDVKWFMPVDLFTRLGRQGRIIKAVGTHGMFKASFNDTVYQHDMICMALYKRVFPKWRTVAYNEADILARPAGDSDDDA